MKFDETQISSVVNVFLNENFNTIPISKLGDAIQRLESSVQDLASEQIYHWLKARLPSISISNTFRTFTYKGKSYQVQAGQKIGSPTIEFAILPIKLTTQLETAGASSKIESHGVGMYNSIEVLTDKRLPIDSPCLVNYISNIFRSSYSWLYEYIRKRFRELEAEVSTDFYFHARSIMRPHCTNEVLSSLLFGIQSKGRSQYILDGPAMESVLVFFAKRQLTAPLSLARLFMEMVAGNIDFEKSFAKIAIGRKDCIDIDLSTSKYFKESTLFEIAEELHFDALRISIFPIHTESQPFLCAVFPTSFKTVLLPLLRQNRPSLDDYFNTSKTKMRRFLKNINSKFRGSFDWGKVGEFVGGIYAGASHPH